MFWPLKIHSFLTDDDNEVQTAVLDCGTAGTAATLERRHDEPEERFLARVLEFVQTANEGHKLCNSPQSA